MGKPRCKSAGFFV